MGSGLSVHFLGGFCVHREGRPIEPEEWRTEKNKALLAILLSERGRTFTKEELIERLWPEAEPGKAAATLRKRVSELRRILEPELAGGAQSRYILTSPQGYRFNDQADCETDVERLAAHYELGREYEAKGEFIRALREYERAARLYRGDYLPEYRYEEWAIEQRRRWQELYLDLLSRLAECHARLGHYRRAIAYCERALAIRNYCESIYRQLMLYHYLRGDRAMALQTYERCSRALREGLGVEPEPETKDLCRRIVRGELEKAKAYTYRQLPEPARWSIPLLDWEQLPFVGRKRELGCLLGHLKEARGGRGRLVLIAGEAGVGKTRLAQEVLDRAQAKGALILQGRCLGMGQPYQPIADAIRDSLPYLSRADLSAIERAWLAAVAELIPEVGSVAPAPSPSSPPPSSPIQARERLFEGLAQFLIGLASSRNFARPLVLFLDDLHQAHPSMVSFLGYLLLRLPDQPILIIGTYRSEEVRAREGHPLLRLERQMPRAHKLSLSPLPFPATVQLIERLFPSLASDLPFCHQLHRRTGGNPLFIAAILQDLLERGLLKIEAAEDGTWKCECRVEKLDWEAIPPAIEGLIQRRLEQLSIEERELLELAAVIGREFELDLLKGAWGRPGKELLALLARLRDAHLLTIRGEGRWGFAHELIWEAVKAGIGPEEGQGLHFRVARSLEQLVPPPEGSQLRRHYARLAEHFYRAGEWERALHCSLEALKGALGEYQNEEGLQLAALGLEALEKLRELELKTGAGAEEEGGRREKELDEKEYELLEQQAIALDLLGRREEQARAHSALLELAERLGDELKLAQAHELRARYYLSLGEHQEGEREAKEGLRLRRRAGDKRGEGLALNLLGDIYRASGRLKDALEHFEQAYMILEEAGDRRGVAMALNNLGIVYRGLAEYQKALSCLEEACKLRQKLGDKREEAQTLANIGNVYWALGRPQDALKEYKKTYGLLRAIGDRKGEGMILFNLGIAHSDLGEYDEALSCYERAYRIFKEVGDKAGEGAALSDIGLIYATVGEHEKALGYLERACRMFEELGERHRLGLLLNNLGNLYLGLEEHQKALEYFQRAHRLREELGDRRRQALDLGGIGAAHLGLGDYQEALKSFEQALKIADELGLEHLKLELLSRKGLAHLGLGDHSQALRCSHEAIRLLEEGKVTIEHPEEVYFNHFRVLRACGEDDPTLALEFLKKAHDEVARKAASIKDEALRESFLTAVKLNQKILKEWEQRTGAG